MATKYVRMGIDNIDPEEARLLSRLVSSTKTLRSVRKNPDQLTEAGSTLIHDYEERFISAFDAADDRAPDTGRLRNQVEALRFDYNDLMLRRRS